MLFRKLCVIYTKIIKNKNSSFTHLQMYSLEINHLMTMWLGRFAFNKSNPPEGTCIPQEITWNWTPWQPFPWKTDITIQQGGYNIPQSLSWLLVLTSPVLRRHGSICCWPWTGIGLQHKFHCSNWSGESWIETIKCVPSLQPGQSRHCNMSRRAPTQQTTFLG